ncbi:hypothetical protein ABZ330_00310 [Streptomyces sp. NPDC006172]|uniref:hypothetical protein n=1 Tax=Streptomyces sp. NPDC006172 TaxID=3154470 RepID=UPI0033C70294
MAHTFENLVTLQRAADTAHAHVLHLRDQYGRPTQVEWTDEQTLTYEKAWKNWRELAAGVQAAVTEHAEAEKTSRYEVEVKVRKTARHTEAAGS